MGVGFGNKLMFSLSLNNPKRENQRLYKDCQGKSKKGRDYLEMYFLYFLYIDVFMVFV